MPTISPTSVPSNATTTIQSKDRESVRRRLFTAKTFTEIGTQTGPDAATDTAEAEAESDLKCSICLEQTEMKNVTTTACGHMFCTSCLLKHLAVRNTCPNCRTEIETARAPAIEPLNATVVANIIRDEENTIDLSRRIAVIGAFPDPEGRAAMILSLSRELAFGSAHSMAGWQGTSDETYHASWSAYEYNGIDDDDEEDDEDDEDDDDDDEGEDEDEGECEGQESGGRDGDERSDSDDESESIDLDPRPCQIQSSPFVGEVQESQEEEPTTPIFRTPLNGRSQVNAVIRIIQRPPFQSPQFQQPNQIQQMESLIGQPIGHGQPTESVEPPIRLNQLNPSRARGWEIDYFDLIVGNVIRVTLFALVLFIYSR